MTGKRYPRNGSTVLSWGAGRPSASTPARRNADLFWADLMGRPAPPPFEDQREGVEHGIGTSGREPFFGDEPGEAWRVVARPGARARRLSRLRDGDLIVRRTPAERGDRGWQCLRKEDVDVETLLGPDGRLRADTVVLRRVSSQQRAHEPEAAGEALGESELAVGEPEGGAASRPRLLKITYRQMFTIDNRKTGGARLRNTPVAAGIEVTIGSLSSKTNASGVATFDIAAIGAGTHRAIASARSIDKAYDGVTGPLVLPRPAPKDDVLYRDMDIQFVVDAKLEVSAAASDRPALFAASTDGGVWREGPLLLLVDWKPVWLRAVKHAPRPGAPHPNDVPNILVVHRTAGTSIAGASDLITGGTDDLSAHYVVDVDGYVLKLVREDEVSNHAGSSYWRGKIGVNSTSVGIEIVSAEGHDYPPRQMQAVRDLMWQIRRAYNIPLGNVVGHSDVDVINTRPAKSPIDLTPGTERPHDPGIEFDWSMLGEQYPALGALGDRVALAADPAAVPAALQSEMYGGYFNLFTDPWVNGDRDSTSRWGGKPRTGLATADPIAELQRDFKEIGYSIARDAAQVPSGNFDPGLGRLIVRFKHRWFGGPKNKARRSTFKDKPHFDRETAIMVKAVVLALRATQ